ncbi:hypothetical protein Dip518_001109 [Parelusimicrobium proximum]|uniref:hypothetical protein n=1 Tax=Parelusimicrobium proximum TaxID=3228953 RepID=UPI003D183029
MGKYINFLLLIIFMPSAVYAQTASSASQFSLRRGNIANYISIETSRPQRDGVLSMSENIDSVIHKKLSEEKGKDFAAGLKAQDIFDEASILQDNGNTEAAFAKTKEGYAAVLKLKQNGYIRSYKNMSANIIPMLANMGLINENERAEFTAVYREIINTQADCLRFHSRESEYKCKLLDAAVTATGILGRADQDNAALTDFIRRSLKNGEGNSLTTLKAFASLAVLNNTEYTFAILKSAAHYSDKWRGWDYLDPLSFSFYSKLGERNTPWQWFDENRMPYGDKAYDRGFFEHEGEVLNIWEELPIAIASATEQEQAASFLYKILTEYKDIPATVPLTVNTLYVLSELEKEYPGKFINTPERRIKVISMSKKLYPVFFADITADKDMEIKNKLALAYQTAYCLDGKQHFKSCLKSFEKIPSGISLIKRGASGIYHPQQLSSPDPLFKGIRKAVDVKHTAAQVSDIGLALAGVYGIVKAGGAVSANISRNIGGSIKHARKAADFTRTTYSGGRLKRTYDMYRMIRKDIKVKKAEESLIKMYLPENKAAPKTTVTAYNKVALSFIENSKKLYIDPAQRKLFLDTKKNIMLMNNYTNKMKKIILPPNTSGSAKKPSYLAYKFNILRLDIGSAYYQNKIAKNLSKIHTPDGYAVEKVKDIENLYNYMKRLKVKTDTGLFSFDEALNGIRTWQRSDQTAFMEAFHLSVKRKWKLERTDFEILPHQKGSTPGSFFHIPVSFSDRALVFTDSLLENVPSPKYNIIYAYLHEATHARQSFIPPFKSVLMENSAITNPILRKIPFYGRRSYWNSLIEKDARHTEKILKTLIDNDRKAGVLSSAYARAEILKEAKALYKDPTQRNLYAALSSDIEKYKSIKPGLFNSFKKAALEKNIYDNLSKLELPEIYKTEQNKNISEIYKAWKKTTIKCEAQNKVLTFDDAAKNFKSWHKITQEKYLEQLNHAAAKILEIEDPSLRLYNSMSNVRGSYAKALNRVSLNMGPTHYYAGKYPDVVKAIVTANGGHAADFLPLLEADIHELTHAYQYAKWKAALIDFYSLPKAFKKTHPLTEIYYKFSGSKYANTLLETNARESSKILNKHLVSDGYKYDSYTR